MTKRFLFDEPKKFQRATWASCLVLFAASLPVAAKTSAHKQAQSTAKKPTATLASSHDARVSSAVAASAQTSAQKMRAASVVRSTFPLQRVSAPNLTSRAEQTLSKAASAKSSTRSVVFGVKTSTQTSLRLASVSTAAATSTASAPVVSNDVVQGFLTLTNSATKTGRSLVAKKPATSNAKTATQNVESASSLEIFPQTPAPKNATVKKEGHDALALPLPKNAMTKPNVRLALNASNAGVSASPGGATPLVVVAPPTAPLIPNATLRREPAKLSSRHRDRLLLAQLEADLRRADRGLDRANESLSRGQKQLMNVGATLRTAMLDAGSDAKGLHPFVRVAMRYAGTPYVWGGESRNGFDCSGFIIVVMRDLGMRALPHSAAEQFNYGTPVAQALLKPGDIVFFKNTYKAGISHVGIYLGRRRYIEAAGTGKGTIVSSLDSAHAREHYAGARRLIRG